MSDCTTYDLTICNNYDLEQKYVYVFMIFPRFKIFINIHEYTNQIIICICYH